jgi:hypothetical protein
MTAQILPFIQANRHGEAESEARAFLEGRHQVTSQELADHFTRRGWALGARRAGHMLLQMGWSCRIVRRGDRALRVYTRPSPIADGSWRRPWLEPAERHPDQLASRARRRRWNRACLIFAGASLLFFIGQLVRLAVNHGSSF